MATQQKFTLNTSQTPFPFLSKLAKKGSIIPNLDQERVPPQPIYMENVVPTQNGVTSIGYLEYANVFEPDPVDDDYYDTDVFPVYSANQNTGYVIIDRPNGKVKIYGPWVGITEILDISSSEIRPNLFFFRDRTWIFHPSLGLRYITNDFVTAEETINGLDTFVLRGITASISYLIAWDDDRVYWSDPINFTEFDPSVTGSGAGSTGVLGVKGKINIVLKEPQGFIIYTNGNATRARFTQNVRNPWIFDELRNSTGVANSNQVTNYENIGTHFMWADAGFAVAAEGQVEYPFSDLTEFLAGDIREEISFLDTADPDELEFERIEEKNVVYRVKVSFVANRYIAISYGPFEEHFTNILLFDIHLERWGRLELEHEAVFNFIPPRQDSTDIAAEDFLEEPENAADNYFGASAYEFLPKTFDYNFWGKDFAILKPDGDVVRATTQLKGDPNVEDAGVLLYGEIALTRGRYSEISEVEVSGLLDYEGVDAMDLWVRSPDTTENIFLKGAIDLERERYVMRSVGRQHQILIRGRFNVTTLVASLIQQGMM